MLLCQNSSRHQIHYLLALLYCLEGCPDGNLRLAVAHIPADQPVHDLGTHHILFDRLDGRQLPFGLLVWKRLLKLLLPYGIRTVDIAVSILPSGV